MLRRNKLELDSLCINPNYHSIDEKVQINTVCIGVSCSYEGSEHEGKYITRMSTNIKYVE